MLKIVENVKKAKSIKISKNAKNNKLAYKMYGLPRTQDHANRPKNGCMGIGLGRPFKMPK